MCTWCLCLMMVKVLKFTRKCACDDGCLDHVIIQMTCGMHVTQSGKDFMNVSVRKYCRRVHYQDS